MDLEAMKNISVESVSRSDLIDLQTVSVSKALTHEERIAEFIRQLKSPYCFIAGKHIVKVGYSENGPTIEECVQGIL
jgi:glutaredoxin